MSRLVSVVRNLGHKRWFARLGHAIVPVDRAIGRLTRGRYVALGLRELPSLMLTTTGRRTGRPRTNPLLYVPDAEAFVVIGSNWGRTDQPAWSGNLLAHPDATVTVGGHRIPVRATLVTGDERIRFFAGLLELWPAYATYEHRAGDREIRIFHLDRM